MANNACPQIVKLAKQQGILRPRDVVAAGLARRDLYRMVARGALRRLDWGLYGLPGQELGEHGTWAEAAKRVPRGVICLISALQFHGLTTQMTPELQIAIEGTSWRPRLRYPPIQVFRFTGEAFTHGVEEHAVGGVTVKVYSPAKTVADCSQVPAQARPGRGARSAARSPPGQARHRGRAVGRVSGLPGGQGHPAVHGSPGVNAHSIFARLKNKARQEGQDFNYLLQRYAIERLLYRVGASEFAARFVLKGATLFLAWTGNMHRVSRDADLLGFGSAEPDDLRDVFQRVCTIAAEDGVVFDPRGVTAGPIRDDQEYGGVRVIVKGRLHTARLSVQVDVGFGDVITPRPTVLELPSELGQPPPRLKAYPPATLVAEKVEAMVHLGMANSRMKDFYNVLVVSRTFEFSGRTLATAIGRTFERRRTALPTSPPLAFTAAFYEDASKQVQWRAFVKRAGSRTAVGDFAEVVRAVAEFIGPVLLAGAVPGKWIPGKGWR